PALRRARVLAVPDRAPARRPAPARAALRAQHRADVPRGPLQGRAGVVRLGHAFPGPRGGAGESELQRLPAGGVTAEGVYVYEYEYEYEQGHEWARARKRKRTRTRKRARARKRTRTRLLSLAPPA